MYPNYCVLQSILSAKFNPATLTMKFFIDTANITHIQEAKSLGILDGVTTNPSLMKKEGVQNIEEHYKKICQLLEDIPNASVSAEVLSTDYASMYKEAEKLASLHPLITVKVPMTIDGLKVIRRISQSPFPGHKNITNTNCTLVFSAAQAILAAKAGATYVSPFIGRIDDTNWSGISLIAEINKIYTQQRFHTQILAASIRSSIHISQCASAGAHIATCPLDTILGMFKHPLTTLGLEKFMQDAQQLK